MRLVLSGFNEGLVDEEVITRMGIAQYQFHRMPDGSVREVALPSCPATDINGIEFYTRYAVNKLKGREDLNSSAWKDAAITKIYQWQDPDAVDHMLVFSCASGAASASIATVTITGGEAAFTTVSVSGVELSGWAPEVTEMVDVTAYGGSAVMTYGEDIPLAVYTGLSYIAPILGTGSPSGAKCVAAWGAYLFAGNIIENGVRNTSKIVWNHPLFPSTFPAANYMELDKGDGDAITAIFPYKDTLVVFKRYRTYLVLYVGGTLTFDWQRIDNSVGCVGPNAVCEHEGILYFIGTEGFYAFDGTHPPYCISTKIEKSVRRTNPDVDYTNECNLYDEHSEIFFLVADGSSERKNKIYIYDPTAKNWGIWNITISSIGNVMYGAGQTYQDFIESYGYYTMELGDSLQSKDFILVFGTYDGYIQKFGQTENDNGTAMDCYWVSPWLDFGYPDRNKRILRAYVYVDSTGSTSYPMTFDVYTDWNDTTPVRSETFETSGNSQDISEQRVDFTVPCRSAKFKIGINQLNTSMTLHKIILDFLIKGRTLVI